MRAVVRAFHRAEAIYGYVPLPVYLSTMLCYTSQTKVAEGGYYWRNGQAHVSNCAAYLPPLLYIYTRNCDFVVTTLS